MNYKLKTFDKNYSIGKLYTDNNTYEFQALINLRKYPQLIKDIWNMPDNKKLKLIRDNKTSFYKVKTIKTLLDIHQFKYIDDAIKYRC